MTLYECSSKTQEFQQAISLDHNNILDVKLLYISGYGLKKMLSNLYDSN